MALRWYQTEAVQAAWQFLCTQAGNPCIDLPTGSGKSLCLAELCRVATEQYGGRVLVLAHRKELLEQNAGKIVQACPGLDVGLFSAGLGKRDTEHSVVVAGIQSAFKRAADFGQRHLVLIDEVHLVPHDGEGMYQQFLGDLRSINPHMRMIGTTATPFRLDCGPLCRPDGLFQKICYSAPIRRLIDEGFLCLLTSTPAATVVDTSNLKVRGGEFIAGDAERLFSSVVGPACVEIVEKAAGRKSILVFCSGVNHAEQVSQCIEKLTGERVGLVTGATLPLERSAILSDFKAGRLRWTCNCDVLTTGYDAPNIDCVAVLRATLSAGLFCQMVGRGFRISPSKADCLVLDFGGNIRRHGPIDDPEYGKQDVRQRHAGEAPTKKCLNCEQEVLIGATDCPDCGFIFPRDREISHDVHADNSQILSTPERFEVMAVSYSQHYKRNAPEGTPTTMRVDYECRKEGSTGNMFDVIAEWVCIEHEGFAQKKAVKWWLARSRAQFPGCVEDAVDLARNGAVASPRVITAMKQGRFWRVLSVELDELPPEVLDDVTLTPFDEYEEIPF